MACDTPKALSIVPDGSVNAARPGRSPGALRSTSYRIPRNNARINLNTELYRSTLRNAIQATRQLLAWADHQSGSVLKGLT